MRNVKPLLAFGLILACCANLAAADQLHPFKTGSLSEIVATREGKPFLLNVWSLDCSACRAEMNMLAKLRKEYPNFNLVLVATDDVARSAEVQAFLLERGLAQVESWIFAEPNPQRLRYEIDSGWYGELPRSYFYDPKHERLGVSGTLKAKQIRAWMQATGH
ncbi:MAG: hypothetical protein USCGTAYLOR_01460 [Chromatiales bacterium USCg_Taylor]|nr:MAG: hypothetical protein USCGTAYLOR_01460 [Chromatiales bacterium USCg_Taylor]